MSLSTLILKKTEEDVLVKPEDQFPGYHRCSSVGWADTCLRHLCLRQLCPEKMERDEKSLIRRMQEGNKQERIMREDMVRWGFDLKDKIRRTDEQLKLTGEPDNFVLTNSSEPVVLDYKSSASSVFRVVRHYNTEQDLLQSRFHWIRKYPAQVQMYLYLFGFKMGMLLFKNKDSGEYMPIAIPENPEYQRFLIDALHDVNKFIAREDAPAPVWVDDCEHCGFKVTACFDEDEIESQEGIITVNDPHLVELFTRREELIEAHKEFEATDKEIKKVLEDQTVIVGDFLYKVSPYERTIYKVPEEIKNEYKDTIMVTRKTIKNLRRPL